MTELKNILTHTHTEQDLNNACMIVELQRKEIKLRDAEIDRLKEEIIRRDKTIECLEGVIAGRGAE